MINADVSQWRSQGWVVIDGLIDRETIAAARAEIQPRSEQALAAPGPVRRADVSADDVRFRQRQFDGTTVFPYPNAPSLNRLMVHPKIVGFAQAALGTDDLRLYQARVWSKYGDHTNYEQPHHVDGNHSLLPIRQGPGWGHVECFVYLHDLDDRTGAPRAVPGHAVDANGLGLGSGLGGAGTQHGVSMLDDAPELYAAEIAAGGSAGSLFAYRSDVWHRGVDIPAGSERHIIAVSFRPADVTWIGFDSFEPAVSRADFVTFAEQCTPDELALFGIPRPGHAFWTPDVLDATQRIYPKLDLTPWRRALG